jgi:transcriptional regulator with XRE-family HTH domain
MGISRNILKLRDRLDLTQERLAKAFGLAGRLVVYRWEAGTREPVETIRRLVMLLNDLPKEKALELISKLESYGKK